MKKPCNAPLKKATFQYVFVILYFCTVALYVLKYKNSLAYLSCLQKLWSLSRLANINIATVDTHSTSRLQTCQLWNGLVSHNSANGEIKQKFDASVYFAVVRHQYF